MLVATTSAVVASGDTLVFTYKNVTTLRAPRVDYDLSTTVASISAESIPRGDRRAADVLSLSEQVVTAIAIEADDSFFAGESLSGRVTLWGGDGSSQRLGRYGRHAVERFGDGKFHCPTRLQSPTIPTAQPSPTTTLLPVWSF